MTASIQTKPRYSFSWCLLGVLLSITWSPLVASAEPPSAVGWRGNGSGRFPDADPPTHWERRAKSITTYIRSSAAKPAGTEAAGLPLLAATNEIPEWLALGPLPYQDAARATDEAQLADETSTRPDDGDRVGALTWTRLPAANVIGKYNKVLYPPRPEPNRALAAVVYFHTYLHSPQAGKVALALPVHTGGCKIWLNSKVVHHAPQPRSLNYQPIVVDLVRGWNRLLVKLANPETLVLRLDSPTAVSFTTKNFAWMTRMPGISNACPIILGERVFVTAEPYYLLCLNKKDGKILWMRSHSYYDGHREELDGKPQGAAFKKAWTKLQDLNERLIREINAAVSTTGNQPGYRPETWAEKEKCEKALLELVKTVDPQQGELLSPASAWEQGQPGWAVATPCGRGDRVYAWFQQGIAVCYDLDGNRQWLQQLPFRGNVHHGYSASPVLAGDKFIVTANHVTAFDARTGTLAWKEKNRFGSWASLLTCKVGSDDVLMTGEGSFFRSADGKPLWRPAMLGNSILATPIVQGNTLYAVKSGALLALDLPRDVRTEPKKRYEAEVLHFPFLPTREHSGGVGASPLFHEGLIYCVNSGGRLRVVEAPSGKEVYTEKLDVHARVAYTDAPGCIASPCLAGKYVYVFDNSGITIVLKPGRKFEQVARNQIECHGEQQWSTPVFDGQRMYLRSPFFLYCVGAE